MGDTPSKSRTEAAQAEGDAIEARAIDRGRRRPAEGEDVTIAESRGVYRDTQGKRRIVGGGQAVPFGWTRESDAPLDGRADRLAARGGGEGNAGEPTKAGTSGGASK